jgi:hypothetical protein
MSRPAADSARPELAARIVPAHKPATKIYLASLARVQPVWHSGR